MTASSLFDVGGKVSLVTGAGRGIGRSIALALGAAGSRVAAVDIDEREAAATADSLRSNGAEACALRCDVTNPHSVRSMVNGVVSAFGRLDVAVNNAGIFQPGLDEEQSLEQWEHVIRVNLTGTWLCASAEMAQMSNQEPVGGKIINLGSIAATRAISNGSYDASKAAVVHLSRTLAVQWGGYNISVNCVSPGYVGTVFGETRSEEERARIREITPLGYVLRLQDLHGPILFLASSASNYITGQNLIVDGGHVLSTWLRPLSRATPAKVTPEQEID